MGMGMSLEMMPATTTQGSNENLNSENKPSYVTYYNANDLIVRTKNEIDENKFVYGGVSTWQGVRSLQKDLVYLISGTTDPNPQSGNGLIYKGNISCTNGQLFYLNVPGEENVGTSVYGPNYDLTIGLYSFVGSFTTTQGKTLGFYFQGHLNEASLSNKDNFKYPSVNKKYDITFIHSTMSDILVGNTGNNNDELSFLYHTNSNLNNYIPIEFPHAKTTTTYGVWYNGNNLYTLVGGYSINKEIPIDLIYDMQYGIPIPYGKGFVVTYNADTQEFKDWTSVSFPDTDKNIELHIQGISKFADSDVYSVNIDSVSLNEGLQIRLGYYTTMYYDKNLKQYIIDPNYTGLDYPENPNKEYNISSSNSVADNNTVGVYISPNGNVAFQSQIN